MSLSQRRVIEDDCIAAWARQPFQMAQRFVVDACMVADHGHIVDATLQAMQHRAIASSVTATLAAIVGDESRADAAISDAAPWAAPPQLTAPQWQACHAWSMLARDPWALLWALLAGALPSDDPALHAQRVARLAVWSGAPPLALRWPQLITEWPHGGAPVAVGSGAWPVLGPMTWQVNAAGTSVLIGSDAADASDGAMVIVQQAAADARIQAFLPAHSLAVVVPLPLVVIIQTTVHLFADQGFLNTADGAAQRHHGRLWDARRMARG